MLRKQDRRAVGLGIVVVLLFALLVRGFSERCGNQLNALLAFDNGEGIVESVYRADWCSLCLQKLVLC